MLLFGLHEAVKHNPPKLDNFGLYDEHLVRQAMRYSLNCTSPHHKILSRDYAPAHRVKGQLTIGSLHILKSRA